MEAKPTKDYIEDSIQRAAALVEVPVKLLRAICVAESNLDPQAYVHADGGGNNHAVGICQVLVATATEYGLSDPRCSGDFRDDSSKRKFSECRLFGPFTNANYAAKFLKSKLNKYEGSWINAIAAYNSGTIRTCPKEGFYMSYRNGTELLSEPRKVACVPGELLNRKYVDRVLRALRRAE